MRAALFDLGVVLLSRRLFCRFSATWLVFMRIEGPLKLLVLSFDGKDIVMRPEGLRESTRKASESAKKLKSRLSAGEKKDRKRMAEVVTVYTVKAHQRTPESIMQVDDKRTHDPPRRATPIKSATGLFWWMDYRIR